MLIINNLKISTSVVNILDRIREITSGDYLRDIKENSTSVMITCPFHGEHHEHRPSCGVIVDKESQKEGVYHCFTCGAKGPIWSLVSECLHMTEDASKDWLTDNFADVLIENSLYIPEFSLNKSETGYLSEKILNKYEYDNERALWYLTQKRRLKKEVIDYFKVGYDTSSDSVTFPIWDETGGLVGVSERSISGKRFNLPKIKDKPCYLLNTAIQNSYTHVYVVESQINALDLYSNGVPAVALFGTGTKHQYEVLNKSGIRHFTLCFDGDSAGRAGAIKFYKAIRKDCIIDYIEMPNGRDVNNMEKADFFKLPILPVDKLINMCYNVVEQKTN